MAKGGLGSGQADPSNEEMGALERGMVSLQAAAGAAFPTPGNPHPILSWTASQPCLQDQPGGGGWRVSPREAAAIIATRDWEP